MGDASIAANSEKSLLPRTSGESMVKGSERVILVQANPPDGDQAASIEWTDADISLVDSEGEASDTGERESKVKL